MGFTGQMVISPLTLVMNKKSPIRTKVLISSGQVAQRDCSVSPLQELLQDPEVEKIARSHALEDKRNPSALLLAGLACTLSAPKGQLNGRAGRKCHLEDGERYLERAIGIGGDHPVLVAALCLNYMAQRRGKELLAESRMRQLRIDMHWDKSCNDTIALGLKKELCVFKEKLTENGHRGSTLVPTVKGFHGWLFSNIW